MPIYHKTHPDIEGITKISQTTIYQSPLNKLRRNWLRLALIWLLIWLLSYRLLLPVWPNILQWLIISGLALGYSLWILWRDLALNHRPGESLLFSTVGWGNHLSMLRGLIVGLLSGFLFSPTPVMPLAWLIALLYTAATVADWFDGYVARKTNHVTELGQRLDMEFDAMSVAIVSLLAIGYGQLSPWFLSVALARYLFVFGLWWRRRAHKPVYEIPPSDHRRIMAGMMMGMMTVVLWPIVPAAMATIAGFVIAIPVLLGFCRDCLFASGRLDSDNATYRWLQHRMYVVMALWFPLLWRLLLGAAMTHILQQAMPWYRPQVWLALLASWHVPLPGVLATTLSITAVAGALFVLIGFMGRFFAILLFFPIGFDIATRDLLWDNGLALVCALCIALLGSGLFSLWQPEDAFVSQRRGAKETNATDPVIQ
jgi:CDP-diacylglycerol--glycerol-3-phosphate 3-phosphatidyltransferase